MKQLILAAIIGAIAFVPAVADAQSHRDGSRGYSQEQRHDRGREHNRAQYRGHQRGYQRTEHRGHRRGGRDAYRDHHRNRQWAEHRGHHRAVVQHGPRHRAPPRHVTRVVYAPSRPVYRDSYYRDSRYHDSRWQRGQYLPPQYRGGGYYVDHRRHRFAAPPPGHRYVRIDGDAVLIGVATGLITAVLAGAFH